MDSARFLCSLIAGVSKGLPLIISLQLKCVTNMNNEGTISVPAVLKADLSDTAVFKTSGCWQGRGGCDIIFIFQWDKKKIPA